MSTEQQILNKACDSFRKSIADCNDHINDATAAMEEKKNFIVAMKKLIKGYERQLAEITKTGKKAPLNTQKSISN